MLLVFINLKSSAMKIKILSLCLLCFAISFSCKKDNYLKMDSTESLLLSQILIDKTPSFEYTYNSAKFINEEKSKFAYSVNHYNDLNQLVTVEYYANFDILSNNPQVAETVQFMADLVLGTTAFQVQHSLSVPVLLLRAK